MAPAGGLLERAIAYMGGLGKSHPKGKSYSIPLKGVPCGIAALANHTFCATWFSAGKRSTKIARSPRRLVGPKAKHILIRRWRIRARSSISWTPTGKPTRAMLPAWRSIILLGALDKVFNGLFFGSAEAFRELLEAGYVGQPANRDAFAGDGL